MYVHCISVIIVVLTNEKHDHCSNREERKKISQVSATKNIHEYMPTYIYCMHVYMYINVHIHIHVLYIYIYICCNSGKFSLSEISEST